MNIELYEDRAGEWRWRAVARNGKVIADSAEGYKSRSSVKRAAATVAKDIAYATIDGELYFPFAQR